eukprot:scaffold7495_cov158-Amphora_coffeaeformis.AAC.2
MNLTALFLFGSGSLSAVSAWMPQTNYGVVAERPGVNIAPNFPISTTNNWSPRQQSDRWGISYNDRSNSMYHRERSEKYVSGNAREYFPTDAMAPATEISLQSTDGRPLEADVEVFDGPDNTPVRFKVYSENGRTTPVRAIVGMYSNSWDTRRDPTVSVRNTGTLEFPLLARVLPTDANRPTVPRHGNAAAEIHGDSLRTWTLDPGYRSYGSAAVVTLSSPNGTPVQADVQLWGVSNRVLQKIRIHQQDGLQYPTSIVVDTSLASVIAVKNIGPMTFPIRATVEPYYYDEGRRSRRYDSYDDRSFDTRSPGLNYSRLRNSPSAYASSPRRLRDSSSSASASSFYSPGVDYSNGRNRDYAGFSSDYVPAGM